MCIRDRCNFSAQDDRRDQHLKEAQKAGGKKHKYSREELLEFIRIYAQENQQVPSATDFRRDFLPEIGAFTRMFGSFENARRESGVYEMLEQGRPTRWGPKPLVNLGGEA